MSSLLEITEANPTGLACPPRYGPPVNLRASHRLDSYKKMAKLLGYKLMPWQEYFFRIVSEMRENKTPRYKTVGLTLPRQCGKTFNLLVYMVHALLAYNKRMNIVYAAQTGKDARSRLENTFMPIIQDAGLIKPFGIHARYGHVGDVYVAKTHSRLTTYGGSDTSGHGDTLNRAIIDEAFAHSDQAIEIALRPAMRTVRDAQMLIVSAAGDDTSDYFNDKTDRGRILLDAINNAPSMSVRKQLLDELEFAWIEWSAPDDSDIDDPAVWAACTPSLGYLIDLGTIKAERQDQDENTFRRAALNQRVRTANFSVIPRALWESCQVRHTDPTDSDMVVAGIHASPDREFSSIVMAGSNGHIQIASYANGVDYMKEIIRRVWGLRSQTNVKKVAVFDTGHFGGDEAAAMEKEGIEVVRYTTNMLRHACGRLRERMFNGELVVERNQKLTQAVGAGEKRVSGSQWLWDEDVQDVNLTPLISMTLAVDAAKEETRRAAKPDFVFMV